MFTKLSILLTFASVMVSVLCAPHTLGQLQMGVARATQGVFLIQNSLAEMGRNSARAQAVNANLKALIGDLNAIQNDGKANNMLSKNEGEETMLSILQFLEPLGSLMRDLTAKAADFKATTIQGDNSRRIVGVTIVQLAQQNDATWAAMQNKLSDPSQKNQMNTLRSAIQVPIGETLKGFTA
ncbi:hypothetical protein HGRIS_000508 [Hohenbuehelia grisea]|uniref:Uncharacterized protein n=1 Tax=Hohenbuehelia grisea TaxID=104357 RepID=A0ABR3JTA7_9AGAR